MNTTVTNTDRANEFKASVLAQILAPDFKMRVLNVNEYDDDEYSRGMQVMLYNGYTVSVVWHAGAYSSIGRKVPGKSSVETAVWGVDDKFVRLDWCPGDNVQGWQTLDEVLNTIQRVSEWPLAE